MDAWSRQITRNYVDAESIDYHIAPTFQDEVQEITINLIQSQGQCRARVTVVPTQNSRSRVRINIFAENKAEVDCVCTLSVLTSGTETDLQIRSWPFDRSKIKARPEMKIYDSDVIANHGNALGTMKPTEKYYLASKGITDYKDLVKQSILDGTI